MSGISPDNYKNDIEVRITMKSGKIQMIILLIIAETIHAHVFFHQRTSLFAWQTIRSSLWDWFETPLQVRTPHIIAGESR